jgi:hypothetical protein
MTVTQPVARFVRTRDQVSGPVSVEPFDVTPMLGVWRNTNHSTWGIARAELSRRDATVYMRVWGADPTTGSTHDWGEAAVEEIYTDGPFSSRVCGFVVMFDLGHARTRIEANMDHGLSVLAAFTTFTDGSGRANYLTREFYHSVQNPDPTGATASSPSPGTTGVAAARADDRLLALSGGVDPRPLAHRWINPDLARGNLSEVLCTLREGQLYVQVTATGPDGLIDWGEAPATVYLDVTATGAVRARDLPRGSYADLPVTDAAVPAFTATYDHGFMRAKLHFRLNIGLLVAAIFSEFTDGSGRASYYNREVFIH